MGVAKRYYVSYGGGVDSTAMVLLILENQDKYPLDEIIFVNHAGDYPETYEFVELFNRWLWKHYGFEITEIRPHVEGTTSILEYAIKRQIAPLRVKRWCSDKFKHRPFYKYVKRPAVVYLGFEKGEEHRAERALKNAPRLVRYKFPLIENDITRDEAKRIIREHGLPIPQKSGCYFCPFKRKKEMLTLALKYPLLWKHVKLLDNINKYDNVDVGEIEKLTRTQSTICEFVKVKGV